MRSSGPPYADPDSLNAPANPPCLATESESSAHSTGDSTSGKRSSTISSITLLIRYYFIFPTDGSLSHLKEPVIPGPSKPTNTVRGYAQVFKRVMRAFKNAVRTSFGRLREGLNDLDEARIHRPSPELIASNPEGVVTTGRTFSFRGAFRDLDIARTRRRQKALIQPPLLMSTQQDKQLQKPVGLPGELMPNLNVIGVPSARPPTAVAGEEVEEEEEESRCSGSSVRKPLNEDPDAKITDAVCLG